MNLGEVRRLEGDPGGAQLCLRRASFLGAQDSLTWLRLAQLREAAGDTNAASAIYQRAYTRWRRLASVHAERASRMYGARHVLPDDVIPNGLLSYCMGSYTVARAFGGANSPVPGESK